MPALRFVCLVAAALLAGAGWANADFLLLSENFDSMGTGNTVPPAGWKIGPLGTPNGVNRDPTAGNNLPVRMPQETVVADDGNATGGSNGVSYNYGTTGAADRALGNIARTGTGGDRVIQAQITNNSGYALTRLTLSYWGEQWHRGESKADAKPEKLRVYFSTTEVGNYVRLNDPPGTTICDFIAPQDVPGAAQAALDGNAAANRTFVTGSFTPAAPIANGATFYIRWYDYNENNTLDHGLAIDDVVLTGVPEPATLGLMAVGITALLRRRR